MSNLAAEAIEQNMVSGPELVKMLAANGATAGGGGGSTPPPGSVAAMFADHAREVRGGDDTNQAMVNRHDQYWQWCVTEPRCVVEGHASRRGYIQVGPSEKTHKGETDYRRYATQKHAKPLPQFGQYELHIINASWSIRNPWGSFTQLFQQPGGIDIMPREQLIELGFHRDLLVKQARPDLAGFQEVNCPYGCAAADNKGPRWFVNDMGLAAHIQVMHKEAVAATAIGKSVSDAMAAAANANGGQEALLAGIQALISIAQRLGPQPAVEEPKHLFGTREPAISTGYTSPAAEFAANYTATTTPPLAPPDMERPEGLSPRRGRPPGTGPKQPARDS